MCDLIDRIEGDQAQDIDKLTSGFLGCGMIALVCGNSTLLNTRMFKLSII